MPATSTTPQGPICSIGCSTLDTVTLRRWTGPGASGPIAYREVPSALAWAAPDLLAALERIVKVLGQEAPKTPKGSPMFARDLGMAESEARAAITHATSHTQNPQG